MLLTKVESLSVSGTKVRLEFDERRVVVGHIVSFHRTRRMPATLEWNQSKSRNATPHQYSSFVKCTMLAHRIFYIYIISYSGANLPIGHQMDNKVSWSVGRLVDVSNYIVSHSQRKWNETTVSLLTNNERLADLYFVLVRIAHVFIVWTANGSKTGGEWEQLKKIFNSTKTAKQTVCVLLNNARPGQAIRPTSKRCVQQQR